MYRAVATLGAQGIRHTTSCWHAIRLTSRFSRLTGCQHRLSTVALPTRHPHGFARGSMHDSRCVPTSVIHVCRLAPPFCVPQTPACTPSQGMRVHAAAASAPPSSTASSDASSEAFERLCAIPGVTGQVMMMMLTNILHTPTPSSTTNVP